MSAVFLLTALGAATAFADVVYVTSEPQGCTTTTACPGPNTDGTYTELVFTLGFTGIKGSAPGRPTTPNGSRAYLASAILTDTTAGVDITPQLGVAGTVYQIDYNWNANAGNSSTDVVLSASCSAGSTLSFSSTDLFRRSNGIAASWKFMGYVTNGPGISAPVISFRYQSGLVTAAQSLRLLFDCWRFTLVQPCLTIPVVNVTGPIGANSTQVVVTGVTNTATKITVYQDSGSGMVAIGSKTTGIVNGNNTVTVSGLVKGAQAAATQTIGGQEGCTPTAGIMVGGGANPRIRVALSIRETSSSGPIGSAGDSTSANIHFLGATTTLGGSPADGPVLNPSTSWQTLTLQRGLETVGDSSNAVGTVVSGAGYNPNDIVSIQAFAYRTLHGVSIYSAVEAQSSDITSNGTFSANWTWAAVPGAQGYRLLRNLNAAGYNDFVDVPSNNYSDGNTAWTPGIDVFLKSTQTDPSIQWNPTVGNSNNLPGEWGILEAIALTIDDLTDTGPYDIYIDNVKNATTVFQDFENSVAGTTDVGFRAPGFSGTTSGNLLGAPNAATVSNGAADTGTKSLRVQFQWNGTNSIKWLRLTTSGVGNPQVHLPDPISIRFLLLPVGSNPVPPAGPVLSISSSGGNAVLDWPGAHNLQAAPVVGGPYTNIPGITTAPYTDTSTPTTSQRYFRLTN
jgi:hypothetical protein